VTRPRFYVPEIDPANDVVLPPDESHHLVRVLRLGRGDEVGVFDGRGREFLARVERVDRQATRLRIVDALPALPDPVVPIVLVQAVLKGDKMDGVIRDATMAGVRRIVPITTERSVTRLSSLTRGRAVDRWHRIAISSAKQCRRARLPSIETPMSIEAWLDSPFDGVRLLLSEPGTESREVRSLRAALAGRRPAAVACVIGPEGGWSAAEREASIRAGCVAVTLGPMTLRADAAGLVAVSLVSFALDEDER
jgi:16S rRNA (uracil1498-N3)-methyltransferase